MHSATVEFEGEEYPYIVNGDFSGDIHLLLPAEAVETVKVGENDTRVRVTLPYEVLEEIVGTKIGERLAAYFESATGREIVKFVTAVD